MGSAAAAVVLLVGGGVIGINALSDDGDQLSPSVAQVFEANDTRTTTVATANGGKLVVGVSRSRNQMAVDSSEWDGTESWRPVEDSGPESEFHEYPSRSDPVGVIIGRGYSLWIFVCPVSFEHPPQTSMQ